MFWQGYVQLERVVGKSEVGKKYIDEEFSPCSLSKLNLNFPTSVRAFQLQFELSNIGPNFPTSIFPISFRTFQLKTFQLKTFQLKTLQLLVLSNCPIQLHVSQHFLSYNERFDEHVTIETRILFLKVDYLGTSI